LADEYQVQYEYSAGNTIDFKTNDLKITYHRAFMRVVTRKDGTRVVIDPNDTQYRVFNFTAVISGNTMDTLDGVQMGSITYSGLYPRIQKIYWDGDSTESNIEVAITALTTQQLDHDRWRVTITMEEKDQ
jgi:hypothetical protein